MHWEGGSFTGKTTNSMRTRAMATQLCRAPIAANRSTRIPSAARIANSTFRRKTRRRRERRLGLSSGFSPAWSLLRFGSSEDEVYHMPRCVPFLALLIVPPALLHADAPKTIVLKPARVFDGVSAEAHAGWIVVVRGDPIKTVRPPHHIKI